MKIIEALKQLNVIEKRITKNTEEITKYASILSTERPAFDSEADQRKQVAARIQANRDLITGYLRVKSNIEHTNLNTFIEMGGTRYSIASLLVIKRKLAKLMLDTYSALNTSAAYGRSQAQRGMASPTGDKVVIIQLYDEKEKNEALREWQDLYDNISSRLEVINATTDIIEASA